MKKIIFSFMFILYSLSFSTLKVENNQVIDSYNNKIELKEYKKIVVLDPAVIETLYLIGAENHIAAIGTIARSKIYPEEKVKLLPNVGHINNSSVEKILSFSPDLVLINAMSPKLGDTLKPFNIPYIVVEANSFNDILNNIKLYGKLTGNEENADLLYNKSIEKLNNIKSKITAQPLNMKGIVLYSTSPMMAFNSKSLPGQILSLLGIENLADNLVGDKPIISPEFLLQQNPDFLAGAMSISKPEDILNSNIIVKETTAGKNNNLFIVDSTKILRGSPRIFEAVEELYKELENLKNN